MVDMDEDGVDVETLQAQIDMSMAFTHNLVSGWMKTSKAKLPSSRTHDGFELEEYMRRPPRYVFQYWLLGCAPRMQSFLQVRRRRVRA